MLIKLLQDLDGTVLDFRNQRQPAERYLFFRYFMTYVEKHLATGKELLDVHSIERLRRAWRGPVSAVRSAPLRKRAYIVASIELPSDWTEKVVSGKPCGDSAAFAPSCLHMESEDEENLMTSLAARWICQRRSRLANGYHEYSGNGATKQNRSMLEL